MVEFIKNMLADERGSISHKRTLAFIGSFILFGVYCFSKDSHLADLIFYLVCAWCGLAIKVPKKGLFTFGATTNQYTIGYYGRIY